MVDEKEKEPQPNDFEKLLEFEKKRSEDYLTRLQYMQADFENLKKRFDRETENIKKFCNERIIADLLDVVDELELAVKVAKDSDNEQKSLVDGVEMTLKKLRKVLEQEGVSPIECTQETVFDPRCHNAIAAEEREGAKECIVVEEIRKGYKMKDKVLRPTIVKVAQPKSK
ncbi:MAG: nucleotide exchange factor GrpE [Candidatus Bathyarchaeia archaeon]|jgi:molecular chaperone GrpE